MSLLWMWVTTVMLIFTASKVRGDEICTIESTAGTTIDYKLVRRYVPFDSAKNICEEDGWLLAMFHSKTDMDKTYPSFCDDSINWATWLGAEWKNSTWHWLKNDAVIDLQNFPGLHFPTGDQDVKLCIMGDGCPQYKLSRRESNGTRRFICMRESLPGASNTSCSVPDYSTEKSSISVYTDPISFDVVSTTGGENTDSDSHLKTTDVTIRSQTASQRIENITDHILHVQGHNITLNESIELTEGILRDMQQIIDDIFPTPAEHLLPEVEKHITKTFLTMFDELAMFILNKTKSGGGAIEFRTRSFVFILEKNSFENLGNTTLMVVAHSGFEIPPLINISPYLKRNATVNRMILRIESFVHEITNMTDQFTTDILTLSLRNEDGEEITVQNASRDIGVWLGNRQTLSDEMVLTGQYIEEDAASNYVFEIMILKPYYAMQVMLKTSPPVYDNTTVCVSTELPGNSSSHGGFQFCQEESFDGSAANIFLPEEKITRTGSYYIILDLIYSHGVEFKVSTTQHRCSYSVDNANTWRTDGCKTCTIDNNLVKGYLESYMTMLLLWMRISIQVTTIMLICWAWKVRGDMLYSIESTSGKTIDYKYVYIKRQFDSAKNSCEADGWHLAMFHSKTDLDDVYREFCDDDTNYGQWLGGEWKYSAWHWVMDDSVIDLQNFPGLDFPKGDQDIKLAIKGEDIDSGIVTDRETELDGDSGSQISNYNSNTELEYVPEPVEQRQRLQARQKGILRHMQEIVDDFTPTVGSNLEPKVEKDITETLLSMFDELALFILNKTTSDNGAIEFKTRSFVFILDKNSLENLGNTTLMVGPNSGFEIPPLSNHLPRSQQNVTNSVIRMAFKAYYAIQVIFETSAPVYENTTVCVSTELPGNSSSHGGFQFCQEASFDSSAANIFLPEENITRTGSYYIIFELIYSHGVEFKVSTTQHKCSYSVDKANTWRSNRCKVSPRSNITSTLCLCSYLASDHYEESDTYQNNGSTAEYKE
ncbi:uncharacterized protein [Ptychodera flava]|uniref:uncharacterized protein n=1 Tax=Ptychodera flava TaxID=63121 RepID=UPI00396A630C